MFRFLAYAAPVCVSIVLSASSDFSGADDLALDLKEISKSATNSKLNIDYQPFIMSVWGMEKLSKLGCLTLKDALTLFPSVDIAHDNIYNQSVIFRGSNPFAYGQSKLFIDGVEVNDRTFDGFSVYLSMPIEMIKRIEVVRGPGGFEAEEGGYAGSVRVITKAKEEGLPARAYAGIGSFGSFSYGAYYGKKYGDWDIYIDGYRYKNSLRLKTEGKDALNYNVLPQNRALSKSGEAPIKADTGSLGINITNNDFSVIARALKYHMGGAFGSFYALSDEAAKESGTPFFIEARYAPKLNEKLSLELKASYLEDGGEGASTALPAGYTDIRLGTVFSNGLYADLALKQRAYRASVSAGYYGFLNNSLKFGLSYSNEKNILVKTIYTNLYTGVGLMDYGDSFAFFDKNAKRESVKIFLNDSVNLSDKMAFTIGATTEKADGFDRKLAYRASLVYEASSVDILKFMLSSAYRLPSWQELYSMNNPVRMGNKNLKPEVVKGAEIQYIKKLSSEDTASVNLFALQNKYQIRKVFDGAAFRYENICNPVIRGGEAELRKNIGLADFLFANYSYARGDCDGRQTAASATHMLKGGYIKELGYGASVGGSFVYVGEKARSRDDDREKTSPHLTADFTLNYDAPGKKWGASAGVKNIADALVLSPSERLTYEADYPSPGRFFFLKLYARF